MILNKKVLKIFFVFILALSFNQTVFAKDDNTQNLFKPISQNGGSTIQFGNKSFNIGGVGSALFGCLNVGSKVSGALSFLDFKPGSVDTNNKKQNQKESCGDALAYAASRVIINNMSKKVTNWAASGNDGNPYYPTDYKSLFSNIKSDEVKTFINELQSADTSNPYNNAFAKSLASKVRSETDSFTEKYKYTGPSADFFKEKSNFNWEDWYKYLQPQNNSLGYSQIATQQIKKLEDQATQTVKEELANNNGFLSQKVCDDKNFKEWKDDTEKSKTLSAAAKGDKAAIERIGKSICKNNRIATPGSIISQQLKDVLGSPLRQAEQADEINETLGAVFDNIVSRMINKGISSLSDENFKDNVDFSFNLKKKPGKNSGSGGDTQDPGSNTQTQGPGSGTQQDQEYDLPTGGSFWDEYNTNFDLRRDLPGIIKTQQDYLAQMKKNEVLLSLVLESIDKIDYALPGPHLGWADGIQERIYTVATALKREFILNTGGIIGNLQSLGMRDVLANAQEKLFINTFTDVLAFYENAITNKFDPSINTNMPSTSIRMTTMIKQRESFQETYTDAVTEIQNTEDTIVKLTDINNQVIALYKRACARFVKENPGVKCEP